MVPKSEFLSAATRLTNDLVHRERIHTGMWKYYDARTRSQGFFQDWQQARLLASQTKKGAISHLHEHLVEFEQKATARGTVVHWAKDSEEARKIIFSILERREVKRIIKSKVMTSEEIHLNDHLERAGYHVLENDLGEYIQQLRNEPPYHFVAPCMHLSMKEISDLFEEKLKTAPTDDPEELTMIARRFLRQTYLTADAGITGANFLIAETGMISITENEGNARLTGALPKTMISLVGIEKVLPKMSDLALFLPMLATAGTGQPITCYNTAYAGPRQPGEIDGPDEWHIVLLDNHRTALLADPEQRDALHCIRCGACLNVCPIFKNIGGISYGTTYQGPIGSVITPHLRGLQDWKHLSGSSSLCGACTATCPVKIDLHHHLLQNRRNAVQERPDPLEGLAWRLFAKSINKPVVYQIGTKLAKLAQPFHRLISATPLDPMRAWTKTRHAPAMAPQSFKDWWRTRNTGVRTPSSAPQTGVRTPPSAKTKTHLSKADEGVRAPLQSRELILARIEEALSDTHPQPFEATAAQKRAVLPAVHDLVPQFAANAEFLRAEFHACADEAAAKAKLAELATKHGWKKIATHRGTLTDALVRSSGFSPFLDTTDGYDRFELEACDAGITECDALIAQTGSVFLTARSGGGRALSVLPEHHVVLARRDQLLADLPAGYELIRQRYGSQWPSLTTLITGPSRTGDIERIIILGAHGPKKLTILLW
ncbi:MAG: LUD domain-containing protein [Prosthecobacter sp.]|uniref:LUD domain-containing protein n=1 Tax=Prosthecobacter sp. TaxID=1965333 RepID=UPI0019EC0342|nr:LUD domain-containing protein [Prosthecobacter sp.]MBE2283186.1 LUD domain-containing protein [Prosthecobacter sp.]